MKIFGRLQSLMSVQEAASGQTVSKQPSAAPPLIPPMPGFGGIWGSPAGSGPSSSPTGSPWAPVSGPPVPEQGHPWAPLPPSAVADAVRGCDAQDAGLAAAAVKGLERARQQQACAGGGAEKRGRRGGKHRDRDRRAERRPDQDLWDMPQLPGRPGALSEHPCLLELPEFFRDSLAPPFLQGALEPPRAAAPAAPAASAEGPEGGAGGGASGPEEDDGEASDEILLGRQLLG